MVMRPSRQDKRQARPDLESRDLLGREPLPGLEGLAGVAIRLALAIGTVAAASL